MATPPDLRSKTILLNIPPEFRADARAGGQGVDRRHPKTRAAPAIGNASLQALFRNLYDAAFITDLAGRIVDANPRAAAAFGVPAADLCGRTISDMVLGLDAAEISDVCEKLERNQFTLIQALCPRRGGSEFPAEVSTSRIRLQAGDYLCFFIRDVTTRRQAEEQLQGAHDALAAQVAERTKLNEELNAEIAVRRDVEERLRGAITMLQAHDQAKTTFVSNVSHELKTPLASIHTVAGNLLKGTAGPLGDKARTCVEMIRSDCQRLARTVEDILDIGRIEAKTLKLRTVNIQFSRFVRRAAESLRTQVEAAGLTYTIGVPAGRDFVKGDPQKLERVIFNLIRNAVKFNTPHGSVEVALRPDPEKDGLLRLDITDTGIGIEPQYLSHITDRFFRIGEYASGAGLGLSICKELIEHHGGEIAFQSPPPGRTRGTLAIVRLPVAPPALVLVATAHGDGCAQLVGLLTAQGYRVQCTGLGAAFETALAAGRPDLVALDWRTEDLAATGAVSSVKASEPHRYLPMLVVAGGALHPVMDEIRCGFNLPVLKEPWEPEACLALLDQVMMGRKDSIV